MSVTRGWVNGGAGIVVSAALAKRMGSSQCVKWYPSNWKYQQNAADVVFGCCVADYWGEARITHHPGFFREPPGPRQHECECAGMCTMTEAETARRPHDAISYHHVPPETIRVRGVSVG